MDQPKVPKGQSANDNGTLDGTLENKILDAIRKKPAITVDQLAEETAIPRRTLMRYMSDMKENNKLVRIGGKRYGHWQINE